MESVKSFSAHFPYPSDEDGGISVTATVFFSNFTCNEILLVCNPVSHSMHLLLTTTLITLSCPTGLNISLLLPYSLDYNEDWWAG